MLKLSRAALLLSTLFLGTSWAQENTYSLKSFGLVGSVSSLTTTSTNLEKKSDESLVTKFTLNFNKAGYLAESTAEITNIGMLTNTKYLYNEKNQIVEEIVNNGETSYTSYKNTYDENGYLIEHISYLANGDKESRTVYIYNEKNELARAEKYTDPDKNPDLINYRVIYRYNAQSLPIEITEKWDGFENVTKLSYDAKGNIIEEYHSNYVIEEKTNQISFITKTYNAANQIAEITYKNLDGKFTGKESFTYDHLDRLTHHSQLTEGGKVISHVHYTDFDDNDNWQKSTTYVGSKATATEERVITYQE